MDARQQASVPHGNISHGGNFSKASASHLIVKENPKIKNSQQALNLTQNPNRGRQKTGAPADDPSFHTQHCSHEQLMDPEEFENNFNKLNSCNAFKWLPTKFNESTKRIKLLADSLDEGDQSLRTVEETSNFIPESLIQDYCITMSKLEAKATADPKFKEPKIDDKKNYCNVESMKASPKIKSSIDEQKLYENLHNLQYVSQRPKSTSFEHLKDFSKLARQLSQVGEHEISSKTHSISSKGVENLKKVGKKSSTSNINRSCNSLEDTKKAKISAYSSTKLRREQLDLLPTQKNVKDMSKTSIQSSTKSLDIFAIDTVSSIISDFSENDHGNIILNNLTNSDLEISYFSNLSNSSNNIRPALSTGNELHQETVHPAFKNSRRKEKTTHKSTPQSNKENDFQTDVQQKQDLINEMVKLMEVKAEQKRITKFSINAQQKREDFSNEDVSCSLSSLKDFKSKQSAVTDRKLPGPQEFISSLDMELKGSRNAESDQLQFQNEKEEVEKPESMTEELSSLVDQLSQKIKSLNLSKIEEKLTILKNENYNFFNKELTTEEMRKNVADAMKRANKDVWNVLDRVNQNFNETLKKAYVEVRLAAEQAVKNKKLSKKTIIGSNPQNLSLVTVRSNNELKRVNSNVDEPLFGLHKKSWATAKMEGNIESSLITLRSKNDLKQDESVVAKPRPEPLKGFEDYSRIICTRAKMENNIEPSLMILRSNTDFKKEESTEAEPLSKSANGFGESSKIIWNTAKMASNIESRLIRLRSNNDLKEHETNVAKPRPESTKGLEESTKIIWSRATIRPQNHTTIEPSWIALRRDEFRKNPINVDEPDTGKDHKMLETPQTAAIKKSTNFTHQGYFIDPYNRLVKAQPNFNDFGRKSEFNGFLQQKLDDLIDHLNHDKPSSEKTFKEKEIIPTQYKLAKCDAIETLSSQRSLFLSDLPETKNDKRYQSIEVEIDDEIEQSTFMGIETLMDDEVFDLTKSQDIDTFKDEEGGPSTCKDIESDKVIDFTKYQEIDTCKDEEREPSTRKDIEYQIDKDIEPLELNNKDRSLALNEILVNKSIGREQSKKLKEIDRLEILYQAHAMVEMLKSKMKTNENKVKKQNANKHVSSSYDTSLEERKSIEVENVLSVNEEADRNDSTTSKKSSKTKSKTSREHKQSGNLASAYQHLVSLENKAKHGSSYYSTLSNLNLALQNMEHKCKQKDKTISTLMKQLKATSSKKNLDVSSQSSNESFQSTTKSELSANIGKLNKRNSISAIIDSRSSEELKKCVANCTEMKTRQTARRRKSKAPVKCEKKKKDPEVSLWQPHGKHQSEKILTCSPISEESCASLIEQSAPSDNLTYTITPAKLSLNIPFLHPNPIGQSRSILKKPVTNSKRALHSHKHESGLLEKLSQPGINLVQQKAGTKRRHKRHATVNCPLKEATLKPTEVPEGDLDKPQFASTSKAASHTEKKRRSKKSSDLHFNEHQMITVHHYSPDDLLALLFYEELVDNLGNDATWPHRSQYLTKDVRGKVVRVADSQLPTSYRHHQSFNNVQQASAFSSKHHVTDCKTQCSVNSIADITVEKVLLTLTDPSQRHLLTTSGKHSSLFSFKYKEQQTTAAKSTKIPKIKLPFSSVESSPAQSKPNSKLRSGVNQIKNHKVKEVPIDQKMDLDIEKYFTVFAGVNNCPTKWSKYVKEKL